MRVLLVGGLALAVSIVSGAAWAQDKVQVGDKGVFPESLTSLADGTLIIGSIGTGEIFKAAPGAGKTEPWIAAQAEAPNAVIGVYADEPNGTLWACYSDLALFSGAGAGSVLRSFDLATGAEKSAVPLGDGTFCNDIATTADGTAYVAETAGGQVLKVAPGATTAEVFIKDEALASADGLSFGPDGALYINGVMTNKLFRLALNADGSAGELTELTLSQPIQGPDGMRFGDDGVLYLVENAASQVVAITFDGDNATIAVVQKGEWDSPTAVTKVGDTLWIVEAKFSKMGGAEDPGDFWAVAVPLK